MWHDKIEILKQIPIVEVAKHLGIEVRRNKAKCYNGHDKKTPSLSFSPKKGLFKCFGCTDGGDNIKLVMNVLKLDFKSAYSWLENTFNLTPPFQTRAKYTLRELSNRKVIHNKSESDEFAPNSEIYEWLIKKTELSDFAKRYLIHERGFKTETVEDLEIRDIKIPSRIFVELIEKFGVQSMLKCGLAKKDERGLRMIWWDHVIVFPFLDLNHRIVFLQARRFNPNGPKYLNLQGVNPTIFNLNVVSRLKNGDSVVFCEGITDTITMIGLKHNALGILGANGFKPEWAYWFLDFSIYVLPDNDNAGDSFFQKIREAFIAVGKPIKKITVPKKFKDLNEFVDQSNR